MRYHLAPKSQPLAYHQYHRTDIRESDKLKGQCYYYCLDCKKWIAWLSKRDSQQARDMKLVNQI